MKKYEAILFDLDGTLLPMDNDVFVQTYMGFLTKKMAPYGYDEKLLISVLWKGTAEMIKNDGSRTNAEVFWKYCEGVFGKNIYKDIPVFDSFYDNEFHKTASVTFPNPLAKKVVELARENADRVILATNPFFPVAAVHARLSWAKVEPECFDLITTYENSSFCKPNSAYYQEIAKKMGVDLKNCLMVGNNEIEDIASAQSLGMDTFYLNDYPVCKGEGPEAPKGSFEDLIAFLQK